MMSNALCPAGAFLAGVSTAIFIKILLVMVFIDPSFLSKFFDLLLYRINGDARAYDIQVLANKFTEVRVTMLSVPRIFYSHAGTIAWGSWTGGAMVMVLSCFIHAMGLVAMVKSDEMAIRRRLLTLMVSSAIIVVWWLLFAQHTSNHPGMIMRLWAWPIAMSILMLQQIWALRLSDGQTKLEGSG